MKKHELINMLLDKQIEEAGGLDNYSIEERDAFVRGCDSIYEMIDGHKTIDGTMKWLQRRIPELKDEGKLFFVKLAFEYQSLDYEEIIETLRYSAAVATAKAITKYNNNDGLSR